MLVLSRETNQSIVVGPDGNTVARITILKIGGGKVRIGIEAPKEWIIHRTEVYEAIKRSQSAVSQEQEEKQ